MSLLPWKKHHEELVADMGIFRVHRIIAQSPRTGEHRRIARVETGDWVNMVALSPEERVILVRQYRHGTSEFTLEIPGGLVDPGETPAEAAARELREETGFAGDEPQLMGVVTPNPAFLDNRCSTYLLENCQRVGEPMLDAGEDIEVVCYPLDQIPELIAQGEIDHALVICGFDRLQQARSG